MDVNNVYNNLKLAWEFFNEVIGIKSYNNMGSKLVASVHYNAPYYRDIIWNSEFNTVIIGDPDNEFFNSFTSDLDILVHEITHGYILNTKNLVYRNESGALHESLADIFGVVAKGFIKNQNFNNIDWVIGKSILRGENIKGLRSLKDPGTAYVNHPNLKTDPQPKSYNRYVRTTRDYGGVHINSGIPNHAFYKLSEFLQDSYPWEKALKTWLHAYKNHFDSNTDFKHARNCLLKSADELFGGNSNEYQAVVESWKTVGIS